MLPGRWRRRDGAPAKRVGLTAYRPSDSTRRSAGYAPCGPSAWRQNRVRDERCNCTRRKRCYSRPEPFAGYRQRRVVVEHRLARLVQLGIRQSRYFGRAKTRFQLYLAATVANMTLVAAKAGLTGDTGGASKVGSAQVAGIVNSATAWLGQNWTLSLLVSALLTKSLFPIRGFRPGF